MRDSDTGLELIKALLLTSQLEQNLNFATDKTTVGFVNQAVGQLFNNEHSAVKTDPCRVTFRGSKLDGFEMAADEGFVLGIVSTVFDYLEGQ